jgi:uncharacterized protein YndB with AHSA1/START domain
MKNAMLLVMVAITGCALGGGGRASQQPRKETVIRLEAVVAGPVDEVLRDWTSPPSIAKFFAPKSSVEPRVGGAYTMIFAPGIDPEGNSYGTRGARILAIDGNRLAFEWYPFVIDDGSERPGPPSVPAAERNAVPIPTWVELRFEPVPAPDVRTRVILEHHGFREGARWEESHAYFQRAWSQVLYDLQRYRRDQMVQSATQ